MKLTTSEKRQAIYIKDMLKTPAWLAVKEVVRDYIYKNVGTNTSPEVLLGMKQAIKEVEYLVTKYEEER